MSVKTDPPYAHQVTVDHSEISLHKACVDKSILEIPPGGRVSALYAAVLNEAGEGRAHSFRRLPMLEHSAKSHLTDLLLAAELLGDRIK